MKLSKTSEEYKLEQDINASLRYHVLQTPSENLQGSEAKYTTL